MQIHGVQFLLSIDVSLSSRKKYVIHVLCTKAKAKPAAVHSSVITSL